MLGLGQQRAVHVGVAARLEHQRRAQVIAVAPRPRRASRASSAPRPSGKPSTMSRSGSPAVWASMVRIVCIGVIACRDHGIRDRDRESGIRDRGPEPVAIRELEARLEASHDERIRIPTRSRPRVTDSERLSGADHRCRCCCPKLDVRAVLAMADLIDAMESALAEFSAGATQQPLRTVLQIGAGAGLLRRDAGVHAGARRDGHQAGDGVREQRRARPAHASRDDRPARSRRPARCGRSWTAATSPKRARPRCRRSRRGCWRATDAGVLAMHRLRRAGAQPSRGAGARAPLREVRVWSPNPAAAARVRRSGPARDAPCPVRRGGVGARGGRTAPTSSRWSRPRGSRWSRVPGLQPGAHICAVGACRPDQREMDTALVRARAAVRRLPHRRARRSRRPPDPDRRGGDPAAHIAGEIGELAAGTIAGRGRRRTRSRSSSRWGWRSRTSPPRTSRSSAPATRGPGPRDLRLLDLRRSAQRFFIAAEIRSRLRPTSPGGVDAGWPLSGEGGCAAASRRSPCLCRSSRSLTAWAFSAASRSRVWVISRSRPPSAHPTNSADLTARPHRSWLPVHEPWSLSFSGLAADLANRSRRRRRPRARESRSSSQPSAGGARPRWQRAIGLRDAARSAREVVIMSHGLARAARVRWPRWLAAIALHPRHRAAPQETAAALRARAESLAYDLDHPEALALLRRSVALAPDDPQTHRALANVLWLNMLFQRGAVTVDHYLGSFSSSTVDLKKPPAGARRRVPPRSRHRPSSSPSSGSPPGPTTPRRTTTSAPRSACRRPTSRRSKAGMLAGFRAARRAYDEHERVLALDPSRKDAGLIVGTYRYVVSTLSLPMRMMAYVAGFGGGRERGHPDARGGRRRRRPRAGSTRCSRSS